MSTTFTRDRVRIAIDISQKKSGVVDQLTEATPVIWRGRDVVFEFALYFGDPNNPTTPGTLIDLTSWSSVTVNIKSLKDKKGDALAQATVASFNTLLTDAEWVAGTAQHFSVAFTDAEMRLDMDNADTMDLYLVVTGLGVNPDAFLETFGTGTLTMQDDGTTDQSSNPALGSSLVPGGASYDGSGHYTLAVTANKVYQADLGPNDTSITNGTDTISADGKFTTQGTSIVLNGTISALVTTTIRNPTYFTAEESDARYLAGVAKLQNDAGVQFKLRSPNGNWIVILGVDDNGNFYTQTQAV